MRRESKLNHDNWQGKEPSIVTVVIKKTISLSPPTGGSAIRLNALIVSRRRRRRHRRCCCCCCCTGETQLLSCRVANSVFIGRGCMGFNEAAHRPSPLGLFHNAAISTGEIYTVSGDLILDRLLSTPPLSLNHGSRNSLNTFWHRLV